MEWDNDWPRVPTLDFLAMKMREYHRRLGTVERRDEKYDPAVAELRLKNIERDIQTVKRALYGLMFVIVAGSVTFAFTVFALLGHRP